MTRLFSMDLRTCVAEAVREHREKANMRQKDLVQAVHRYGVKWANNAVSEIESGRRRADTADDLAVLCMVFGVSLKEFLGDRKFDLGEEEADAQILVDAYAGDSELEPPTRLPGHAVTPGMNLEKNRMAERVGVEPEYINALVRAVYNAPLSLTQVRDLIAEVGAYDTSRSAQAKRGHASRKIAAELKAAIADKGLDALVQEAIDQDVSRRKSAENGGE